MDALGTIFGSEARVRIIRLFLFNTEIFFDINTISSKSKVNKRILKREISTLLKSGLLKEKDISKVIQNKRGKSRKVKIHTYYLNQGFAYITALKQLLIKTKMIDGGEIVRRLSKSGKLKLVIIAGVFTQDKDSRADMLVVGNNISKSALTNAVKSIEAELGCELVYVYFETPDYQYRLGMYDKLVRDILDYPHHILLDKISL